MESISDDDLIRQEFENPDIYGAYRLNNGGWVFDRRMTMEGMERRGLSPRNANLNLMGPDRLPISEYLIEELGLLKPE